jgi:hypothetical protein
VKVTDKAVEEQPMWIKAEDGSIYKLDAITAVKAVISTTDGKDASYVSAVVAGEHVQLTKQDKTAEEALAIVHRLYGHQLGNLDLSKPAVPTAGRRGAGVI